MSRSETHEEGGDGRRLNKTIDLDYDDHHDAVVDQARDALLRARRTEAGENGDGHIHDAAEDAATVGGRVDEGPTPHA